MGEQRKKGEWGEEGEREELEEGVAGGRGGVGVHSPALTVVWQLSEPAPLWLPRSCLSSSSAPLQLLSTTDLTAFSKERERGTQKG